MEGREFSTRQIDEISHFAEEFGLTIQIFHFQDGDLFLTGNELLLEEVMKSMGKDIFSNFVTYQKKNVSDQYGISENDARGDCNHIANEVQTTFFPNLLKFKVSDYGVINFKAPILKPNPQTAIDGRLNFFDNFSQHFVNYIHLTNGLYISVDFTAHYTHFRQAHNARVFCVVSPSLDDLKEKLSSLYKPTQHSGN